MAKTNAEKQADWRRRRQEELERLRVEVERVRASAPVEPVRATKGSKPTSFTLGLLTLTDEEFEWLMKLLIDRRNAPERKAAYDAKEAAKEASIQARRQAQWDGTSKTAPLFRQIHLPSFVTTLHPVENRVLSATRQYVKGIYRHHHTGRLELFTLSYAGWREETDNGWWEVKQGGRDLMTPHGAMEAAGYRAEAPLTKSPWDKDDRPLKDKTDVELKRIRSEHHPDKGNGHADPTLYQQAVEELDRRRG